MSLFRDNSNWLLFVISRPSRASQTPFSQILLEYTGRFRGSLCLRYPRLVFALQYAPISSFPDHQLDARLDFPRRSNFFAGTLFAVFLNRVAEPASALGYNLLDVMVGGALEYTSMACGINNLNLVCVAV